MTYTLVYLIRHGQTAENLLGIIQGQLDTKLDETGVEQSATVARSLEEIPFGVGFTSDLERATAEAIFKYHAGVELCKTELLRERYMGNLQGQVFRKEGGLLPDGTVETSSAFIQRTLQFWDQKIMQHVDSVAKEKKGLSYILVVSHGAFISTLARSLVGQRDIKKAPGVTFSWCPNTSITLIEVRVDGTGTLLSFGDMSHLVEPTEVENVDELRLRV